MNVLDPKQDNTPRGLTEVIEVSKSESSVGEGLRLSEEVRGLDRGTLFYNPRTDDLRVKKSFVDEDILDLIPNQGGTTSSVWLKGDPIHIIMVGCCSINNSMTKDMMVFG